MWRYGNEKQKGQITFSRLSFRWGYRGCTGLASVVYNAYIRWLHTQGGRCKEKENVVKELDGWVSGIKELYSN